VVRNCFGKGEFIIFIVLCGTSTGGSILGLPLLDPLAGLVVSGMILKAGIKTGYER
jgi:divalent metal cation (Fe/Co/Zn/Cd) transporter